MADKNLNVKIINRNGKASEWTSSNPVLDTGEIGLETDTHKMKIGDGATNWTALPYVQGEGGGGSGGSNQAIDIQYNNTTSQLTSTNVQNAIDEVNTKIGNNEIVEIITEEEYSHLLEQGLVDPNKLYYIQGTGDGTLSTTARTTEYDNAASKLQATNVQDALDEINNKLTSEEITKLKALLTKLTINTADITFATEIKADSFDAVK